MVLRGDVTEPEALEGTDGKGKVGGGSLAGSTRRNHLQQT